MDRRAVQLRPLLPLLVFVFYGLQAVSSCETDWFGDRCQFQCHCRYPRDCDSDGNCNNVLCDNGWFGPLCQYSDVTTNTNLLTDRDDTTCLPSDGKSAIEIQLTSEVRFTWMRLVTESSGNEKNFTLRFLSIDGGVLQPTRPLDISHPDSKTIDVHGELPDRFAKINITFDNGNETSSFCSVYVSGGRNVAVKQKSSQSSTLESYESGNAVDGSTSQVLEEGSCSVTSYKQLRPYWSLDLLEQTNVDRFRIYNLIGPKDKCYLRNFKLGTFDIDGRIIQEYNDPDEQKKAKIVYDILSDMSMPITTLTISTNRKYWPDGQVNCTHDNIMFVGVCEVQVFGDYSCPKGKWGLECEKDCNCVNTTESCYASTGHCPSGCVQGNCQAPVKPPPVGSSSSDELELGVIVGIACGGVVLLVAIVTIIACCCNKRAQRQNAASLPRSKSVEYSTTNPFFIEPPHQYAGAENSYNEIYDTIAEPETKQPPPEDLPYLEPPVDYPNVEPGVYVIP